jgi:hypothetical protein
MYNECHAKEQIAHYVTVLCVFPFFWFLLCGPYLMCSTISGMSEMTMISTTAMMIPSPRTLPMDVAEGLVSSADIFFRNWEDKLDFFTVKLFFVADILDSNSCFVLMMTCCFIFEHGHWHPEMD